MRYEAGVIKGRGEGRRIGVPTLNLVAPDGLRTEFGIYAGWVFFDGNAHPAVFHYGPIPVFNIDEPSLEAHLLDAIPEDRPEQVGFELATRLRDVHGFPTVAELVTQIEKDIEEAKRALGIPE